MSEFNQPHRRRPGRARDRHAKRQTIRPDSMVEMRQKAPEKRTFHLPGNVGQHASRLRLLLGDVWWHIFQRTAIPQIVAGLALLLAMLWVVVQLLSPAIGPNVWSMGINLGGLTVEEATERLTQHWADELAIDIRANNTSYAQVRPDEIGLVLSARSIAEQAKSAGLTGFPFGTEIEPVITYDIGSNQMFLLNLVDEIYVPPYEAGYELQNGVVVGVRGRASTELDIPLSLERIGQNALAIVRNRQVELLTVSNAPDVMDPTPYLQQAQQFIESDFQFIGYDPFLNEQLPLTAPVEERIRWIAAGPNGLTLRENAFRSFIMALNDYLRDGDAPRYVEEREVINTMRTAIVQGQNEVSLRIRYLPVRYTVSAGDNGFRIGRKTGLPFNLIDQANPGLNWNALSIGQQITIPSRDLLLLENPIPNKRIIVDLDRLWLVAYEDEEIVFSWPVSSGLPEAPTYPGIFQILQKTEIAYGSSYSLCNDAGTNCGQWQMYWFMGIYEIIPGLMNGFHGAVLLPNGGYLGGGGTRGRFTFGCVMSENSDAEQLYSWADVGTVVEIYSNEFPPESELAKQAQAHIIENSF